MSRTVHVISPVRGFGNRLDLELVSPLLEGNGFSVTRYPVVQRGKVARLTRVARRLLSLRGRFDINLFLAPIFPEWLSLARKNVLIPNAEGFPDHLHAYLPRIDLVLAKTRLTERAFRELGCKTEFIGFTSNDHLDEHIPRDPTRFFHSCSSRYKGTKRLLEIWKAHPEWPELVTVINHNDTISPPDVEAPNIRAILKPLPEEELRRLQNSIPFHLCCSEAEGFGHYIMEAMSCRALTFTTDAPPMNELVDSSRGLLVQALDDPPKMNLAHRYLFKRESLEEQIERALKFDAATRAQLGSRARAFFLENDRLFRRRFIEVLQSL